MHANYLCFFSLLFVILEFLTDPIIEGVSNSYKDPKAQKQMEVHQNSNVDDKDGVSIFNNQFK